MAYHRHRLQFRPLTDYTLEDCGKAPSGENVFEYCPLCGCYPTELVGKTPLQQIPNWLLEVAAAVGGVLILIALIQTMGSWMQFHILGD